MKIEEGWCHNPDHEAPARRVCGKDGLARCPDCDSRMPPSSAFRQREDRDAELHGDLEQMIQWRMNEARGLRNVPSLRELLVMKAKRDGNV